MARQVAHDIKNPLTPIQLSAEHARRVNIDRGRPLSPVLDEEGIDRIDLLKVDVEGAELEVLRGIEERHWPLVRQAVVEVERWSENRDRVREVFATRGFTVEAEQDPVQQAADIGMVFALR